MQIVSKTFIDWWFSVKLLEALVGRRKMNHQYSDYVNYKGLQIIQSNMTFITYQNISLHLY